MSTRSHTPPQDNGYRVYLGDGSQIVPPADTDIASCIAAVGPLDRIPRGDGGRVLDEAVVERYQETVAALVADGDPAPRRDLTIVYTPMHGGGGTTVQRVLERAGFPEPHEPPAQAEPDPDSPIVSFPNPQEPGAMDLDPA